VSGTEPAELPPANEVVRAAGAVVWDDGCVLLIHRPKYDDWSLPKGKLDPGESWEEGALRELEEETGLTGELGPAVDDIRYTDQYGRPKVVRYFTLSDPIGEFVPNREVDEVRWLPLDEACALLTRPADADVVRKAAR
jgi:8-oxo-dGTP pyrophosphatase MutT (NUDIX family)